ncbi:MAG: acyl-CoA/acyl-ACP dehydrogenase [Rhodospirillales bacterium]|nr:acyl-CoA/acyl-ACP dehydrogenase [Rhodospirillales bacterium]MDH3913505.1 acyl-CoA/acyl-ACP dehydrogenase [Rhodospirillales bacterium]MDH3920004.1 acyl-CoA/acyl-ACP dehydrogenase [Rhodospirillales bacterium]MDH3968479.1 acyl-CoA/acyl-ACP dehydrogenase [Rhodospirillales bacterium]
MEFALTEDQASIVDAVQNLVGGFDDDYWLKRDRDGGFPEAFYTALAEGGWLGIALPEAYGGAGLGVTEAALMMMTVAGSGGAMTAASAIHMNVFGPKSIAAHGSDEQKRRWLPEIVKGAYKMCFGVTEPNAGLDTTRITTRAERDGNHYVVHGQKIWISTAQVAEKIMLLARTAPRDDANPTVGLSLFFADLDRDTASIREIEKMGRKAVDSNEIYFDGMRIPAGDRIGEEGRGFRYILDSLNPERILIAAEAIGIGRDALGRAARYARDRVVFQRPIGQNQSIQHPLAVNWAELEAAFLMAMKAAWLYDNGRPCGIEANAAKYLAAEAGFKACKQAVMTHGGMGYAREFHVERLMREVMIPYLAPVSQQMALNFLAERALDLPKSY